MINFLIGIIFGTILILLRYIFDLSRGHYYVTGFIMMVIIHNNIHMLFSFVIIFIIGAIYLLLKDN